MIDQLIRDLIEKDRSYTIGGRCEELFVCSAEEKLGLRFPLSLRAFALSYGYIFGPGGHVSILAPGDDLESAQGETAYRYTLLAREKSSVPSTFIVLNGEDYPPICLDTAAIKSDGKCPVFCYYHLGAKNTRELIADDFAEYLNDWLKVRLDEYEA